MCIACRRIAFADSDALLLEPEWPPMARRVNDRVGQRTHAFAAFEAEEPLDESYGANEVTCREGCSATR
jgi:hypothetical protein